MISPRLVSCLLLSAGVAMGCASETSTAATIGASAVPTPLSSPDSRPSDGTDASLSLPQEFEALAPGTYKLERGTVSDHGTFPPILITVPDGWNGSGRFLRILRPGEDVGRVAVQFWEVDRVYGHPCQWIGTLLRPGPTIDGLAAALADVPLRNATEPTGVSVDGYAGMFLEWSVPADIDFADCDVDDVGEHAFQSWTDADGGGRAQQAPGQVDRLWILDIDGARLVIDAFWLPLATSDERLQLQDVVESIRFERPSDEASS